MVLTEVVSALLQLALFTLPPFVTFLVQQRTAKGFGQYIGLYRSPARANGWALLASLVSVSSTLGVALASPTIKVLMLDPHSVAGQLRLWGISFGTVAVLLVTALVKTALAEEILFRGFIAKRLIAAWGFRVGNVVQAVLFGALHIGLFWIFTNSPLVLGFVFLASSVGAALAAYLNERLAGGSIIPGWILHGMANVVSYFVIGFLL
ncbi:MAG: CPBP family intramembrane metalloprotease [Cytophagaceae bacterium]|nr:MAG: CPBP family intramembrane metalloprotease [Cytophagaceae bacterium]